jgi:ABC-type branched-subunit amino acid transport system ATPase component
MILKKFRVTEFRSVQDSGWIDVEDITALIGTNESGKTNILLPLWKLNPADEGAINLQDDLPREKYHEYRSASPMPTLSMLFTC